MYYYYGDNDDRKDGKKKRGRTVSEEAELMRRWRAQSAATEFNAHTQQGEGEGWEDENE